MSPAILMVAPNGARRGPADHAALPITPAQLAQTAAACLAEGAALLHLHVRDSEGRHTLDCDAYQSAIAAIRRRVGSQLILQVTTESLGRYTPAAQRRAVDEVQPEAVSIAIRELLADDSELSASTTWLESLMRRDVLIQYICYDAADLHRLARLIGRGVVPTSSPSVLLVIGRRGETATPATLLPLLALLPNGARWATCAFGMLEHPVSAAALALGGDPRVGFENNLDDAGGTRATDNASRVRAVAALAQAIGRPLADAETARALLRVGSSAVVASPSS